MKAQIFIYVKICWMYPVWLKTLWNFLMALFFNYMGMEISFWYTNNPFYFQMTQLWPQIIAEIPIYPKIY